MSVRNSALWCRDWLRSARAAPDPQRFFRGRAGNTEPFTLIFPGMGRVTLVTDPSASREILTTPREMFCAPTPNPIEPIIGPESVILTSGEQHRHQRALLSPPFHGAQMRARAEAMETAVREQAAQWQVGDRIALHGAAQAITLRIIIQMVLGVAAEPLRDACADSVTEMMNANTAPLMLLPILRKDLSGHGPWARLQRLRKQFDAILAYQIQLGRRCPMSGHGTVLGELIDRPDGDDGFGDDELLQQLRTLVVAGHDTTASALAWAMYHVHREPAVRDRLLQELTDAPPAELLPKLPYLSGVIAETLRMHPTVPVVLRKLSTARYLAGTQHEPGDVVGIAIPALHFDPSIWTDPFRFRPERFLTRRPGPFEYLPFGGGHRRCLGAAFAGYELAVAVGTLMQDVDLRMPQRELRRKPPGAVPRGIATVPRREITLAVAGFRSSG